MRNLQHNKTLLTGIKQAAFMLLTFVSLNAIAQDSRTFKTHVGLIYPLSTNGTSAALDTNDLSLHLIAGVSSVERGSAFAGFSNIVRNETRGALFAGFANHVGKQVSGGLFAGFFEYVSIGEWITEEERNHILAKTEVKEVNAAVDQAPVLTWKELLKFRNTWGIITGRFFIDPVWWLFVTWLPTFLKEQFMFDIKQIGAFTWVPYLFAAIGSLLGGYHASAQIKKGIEPQKARKNAIAVGSVIMLASLVVIVYQLGTLKDTPTLAMVLIGLTLFGFQYLIGNIQTLPSDYFNGKNVGTVAGMGGTAAVAGTLLTTWAVPVITQTSYVSFFVLAAVLVPVSWLCIKYISSKS